MLQYGDTNQGLYSIYNKFCCSYSLQIFTEYRFHTCFQKGYLHYHNQISGYMERHDELSPRKTKKEGTVHTPLGPDGAADG